MDRRAFLAACSGLTSFAMASRAGEPSRVEIQRRIERLGHRSFAVRERASRALREMGKAAIPALRRAAKQHADAEVRRRAQGLVSKFIDSGVRHELARLRGTWREVSFTADGEFRAATEHGKRWEFDGNLVRWLEPEGLYWAFRCHLNPMATPKIMDLGDCIMESIDPADVPVTPGIYCLDGDRLRVCYSEPGKPRPSEFVSTKDSNRYVWLLERVPQAKPQRSGR